MKGRLFFKITKKESLLSFYAFHRNQWNQHMTFSIISVCVCVYVCVCLLQMKLSLINFLLAQWYRERRFILSTFNLLLRYVSAFFWWILRATNLKIWLWNQQSVQGRLSKEIQYWFETFRFVFDLKCNMYKNITATELGKQIETHLPFLLKLICLFLKKTSFFCIDGK